MKVLIYIGSSLMILAASSLYAIREPLAARSAFWSDPLIFKKWSTARIDRYLVTCELKAGNHDLYSVPSMSCSTQSQRKACGNEAHPIFCNLENTEH